MPRGPGAGFASATWWCTSITHTTPFEHPLNIDFRNEAEGPGARVAVELRPESARELVRRIEAALEAAGEAAR